MRLFGGNDQKAAEAARRIRVARHSSGWDALAKSLRGSEGLRTLDIGPTSSTNINLLTGMGHSVYMADLVAESHDSKWIGKLPDGTPEFRTDDFLAETLQLGDRIFDVVLMWDCLDFLPPAVVPTFLSRIYEAMTPGGRCLVFSHIKNEGFFSRFHLREDSSVDMQGLGDLPPRQVYTNRQIEGLFSQYSSYKFFLAKDNLREILVVR